MKAYRVNSHPVKAVIAKESVASLYKNLAAIKSKISPEEYRDILRYLSKVISFASHCFKQILEQENNGIEIPVIVENPARTLENIKEQIPRNAELFNEYNAKGVWSKMYNALKGPNATIGHSFLPVGIIPIEELNTTYKNHRRLKVFHEKGCKCIVPDCNREGKLLIDAVDNQGGHHVDLYTEDLELMTIDHIHPKSKGGKSKLKNLQPMCQYHNSKKGNKQVKFVK